METIPIPKTLFEALHTYFSNKPDVQILIGLQNALNESKKENNDGRPSDS